ncbi:MAG: nucleotidyltransferase domain-containing protein [Actinobacteria bacterium]|nr:nucleotidyltransferase domain-containing protein [Actinomycetota bacterium]
MPVRLLTSSILKWPDANRVKKAVGQWTKQIVKQQPDVIRIGYFGSYARGDWGVGSDLDIIMIVRSSKEPFEKRASKWDLTKLPVPADLLVYTEDEWQSQKKQQSKFYRMLMKEAVWLHIKDK